MPFSHPVIAMVHFAHIWELPFRMPDSLIAPGATHPADRPTRQGRPPNQSHSLLISSLLFTQLSFVWGSHLVSAAMFFSLSFLV